MNRRIPACLYIYTQTYTQKNIFVFISIYAHHPGETRMFKLSAGSKIATALRQVPDALTEEIVSYI